MNLIALCWVSTFLKWVRICCIRQRTLDSNTDNIRKIKYEKFGNIFMTATAVKLWPLSLSFDQEKGGEDGWPVWPTSGSKSCIRMSKTLAPNWAWDRTTLVHTYKYADIVCMYLHTYCIRVSVIVGYSQCCASCRVVGSVGIKVNFTPFACLSQAVSRQISSLSLTTFLVLRFGFSVLRLGLAWLGCLWQKQQQ